MHFKMVKTDLENITFSRSYDFLKSDFIVQTYQWTYLGQNEQKKLFLKKKKIFFGNGSTILTIKNQILNFGSNLDFLNTLIQSLRLKNGKNF